MATWGLHLRMAEALLARGYDLDEESFAVGNIGPDCGMPNEDWSQFDPPTEISHWTEGNKRNIQSEKFYEAYLKKTISNPLEKSFLIGYYVHLLTDIAFATFLHEVKRHDPLYAPLETDKKFIWTIKEDWYDLDHVYFRDNPDSLFHRVFQHVRDVPNYLAYYPEGAILRQVKYITSYYQNPSENLDRVYIYLTMNEMNQFMEEIEAHIADMLEKKQLVEQFKGSEKRDTQHKE